MTTTNLTPEQIETMDASELVAWMAGLEKECDSSFSVPDDPEHIACVCAGTKALPLYTELRTTCGAGHPRCSDCQMELGYGHRKGCSLPLEMDPWTIIPQKQWGWAMIEIALKARWIVTIGPDATIIETSTRDRFPGEDSDSLTNLARALAKALIAEAQ